MHIVTALPEEEHNFWTLYKMLRLSGDEWTRLLFDLKKNEAEDELISIGAQELIGIEQANNTMAGIKSAAQNATTIFESPQLRSSLSKNDFDPYDLPDGDCTVYIVIPERFLDTHSIWLRLMIGLILKACNARPKKRVNFLLDEFAIMGKMKDVQRGFAFAGGQNIVLWAFVQSLGQLKDNYGEDGMNSFVSNAAVFQAFGVKDAFTTEYVSKLLGETTLGKEQRSYSENEHSVTSSKSYQTFARRLLTPDEVERSVPIIAVVDNLRMKIPRLPYYLSDGGKTGRIDWNQQFTKRADPPPRSHH